MVLPYTVGGQYWPRKGAGAYDTVRFFNVSVSGHDLYRGFKGIRKAAFGNQL